MSFCRLIAAATSVARHLFVLLLNFRNLRSYLSGMEIAASLASLMSNAVGIIACDAKFTFIVHESAGDMLVSSALKTSVINSRIVATSCTTIPFNAA